MDMGQSMNTKMEGKDDDHNDTETDRARTAEKEDWTAAEARPWKSAVYKAKEGARWE